MNARKKIVKEQNGVKTKGDALRCMACETRDQKLRYYAGIHFGFGANASKNPVWTRLPKVQRFAMMQEFRQFIQDHHAGDFDDYVTKVQRTPGVIYAKIVQVVEARELEREISRVASNIRKRVAASEKARAGTHACRELREASTLKKTLLYIWDQQSGKCFLCNQKIPLRTDNKLLKMSPDRTDSSNRVYDDVDNVRIVHFACNGGKSDASLEQWHEYLKIVRSA